VTGPARPARTTDDWQAAVLRELRVEPGLTAFPVPGVPPGPGPGLPAFGPAPAGRSPEQDETDVNAAVPETNGRYAHTAPPGPGAATPEAAGAPYEAADVRETTRRDPVTPGAVLPPAEAGNEPPGPPPGALPGRDPAQPPGPPPGALLGRDPVPSAGSPGAGAERVPVQGPVEPSAPPGVLLRQDPGPPSASPRGALLRQDPLPSAGSPGAGYERVSDHGPVEPSAPPGALLGQDPAPPGALLGQDPVPSAGSPDVRAEQAPVHGPAQPPVPPPGAFPWQDSAPSASSPDVRSERYPPPPATSPDIPLGREPGPAAAQPSPVLPHGRPLAPPPDHRLGPVPAAPVVPPGPAAAPDRGMHGDPLLRRMGRGVRRAIGVSAAQEVHDWAAVGAGLRQPVTTVRRIVVTSVRGGAGKTTVALLLASALARHRQDRVLLIDADPGLGSMAARVGVAEAPALREFAGRRAESFEEIGSQLTRTDSGLWVLPGVRGEMADEALDLATYEAATSVLTRFFTVIVVDCGAGMVGELQEGIIAGAHACVHATPATTEGAIGVGRALDWMRRHGFDRLVPRTMTVFATHAPHARPDLDQAAALLRGNGVGVAYLPYDRHLASGGLLVPALLAESTRSAALEIAAEALTRANH
jgi:MinD-like ATPase involved in chromosome partitioning or flagellar assembly